VASQQLTVSPSSEDLEAISTVIDSFGPRFLKGLELRKNVKDLLVTLEDTVQVQATVHSSVGDRDYAVFVSFDGFVCGCLDNFGRKRICKHILAACLVAYEQRNISYLELLSLLRIL